MRLSPSSSQRGETRRDLLIAGLIIIIIFSGVYIVSRFVIPSLTETTTLVTTPSLTTSPAVSVVPPTSSATALPTRPPEPIPCLPGVGACPDNKQCPKSGVCCPTSNPNCQPLVSIPKAIFCFPPGQAKCPNGRPCPLTGVCGTLPIPGKICIAGSTCPDGSSCPSSGFCLVTSQVTPCIPSGSICPNGSQCPRTGICP